MAITSKRCPKLQWSLLCSPLAACKPQHTAVFAMTTCACLCPSFHHCSAAIPAPQAKGLFSQLSVPAKVIECDVTEGGDKLREGLTEVTGRRTVPQVFIGGKHVGGCDGKARTD